jgi:hypothetical protein
MAKRKYIITAAILAMLGVGFGVTQADSGNSLLQMNVKKSSIADTVDVTFFTTADSGNTVVTRKSNNKYVVLLPNTSSTSSVAPSIGGVKDLVSNIEVKHVNDGIGGYTKVTFETTKPINIKTYTKKANPVTQAQKDYKAILAQNNAVNPQVSAPKQTEQKVSTTQPKTQTVAKPTQTTKVADTTQSKLNSTKQVAQTKPVTAKTDTKSQTKTVDTSKSKVTQPTKVQAEKIVKTEAPKVQNTNNVKSPVQQDMYRPKMQYDGQGNRIVDLEPRVSHSLGNNIGENQSVQSPSENLDKSQNVENNKSKLSDKTEVAAQPKNKNSKSNSKSKFLNNILIMGSILTFGILYLLFNFKKNVAKNNKIRTNSFTSVSSGHEVKRKNKEYNEILNNNNLNWQQKYKTYKEKTDELEPKINSSDMSYVTDLSGLQKAVISSEDTLKYEEPVAKTFEQIREQKMREKVSQMEHSLNQVQEYKEVSNEVQSEENVISKQMSNVKLKSFSKLISLKEANRELIGEGKDSSRNKSYKEGRFVKLKNSPLSATNRGHGELGASDLINTGKKYLVNNGVMKMNKENEKYFLSSLDEYLSILESEEKASATSSANIKASTNPVMSRSGITNPISKSTNKSNMDGMTVKSSYNIDATKGFYLVDTDGVSALVGKIGSDVFMLKKFDYVVDKPLQVRQDDKNIYIVRAGKFKCLVDVSADKMGTLLEI